MSCSKMKSNRQSVLVKSSVLLTSVNTSVLLARNASMPFVQQPSATLLTARPSPFASPRRSQARASFLPSRFARSFSRDSLREPANGDSLIPRAGTARWLAELTVCWRTPFVFSRFSARRLEPRFARPLAGARQCGPAGRYRRVKVLCSVSSGSPKGHSTPPCLRYRFDRSCALELRTVDRLRI